MFLPVSILVKGCENRHIERVHWPGLASKTDCTFSDGLPSHFISMYETVLVNKQAHQVSSSESMYSHNMSEHWVFCLSFTCKFSSGKWFKNWISISTTIGIVESVWVHRQQQHHHQCTVPKKCPGAKLGHCIWQEYKARGDGALDSHCRWLIWLSVAYVTSLSVSLLRVLEQANHPHLPHLSCANQVGKCVKHARRFEDKENFLTAL